MKAIYVNFLVSNILIEESLIMVGELMKSRGIRVYALSVSIGIAVAVDLLDFIYADLAISYLNISLGSVANANVAVANLDGIVIVGEI